MPGLSTIPGGEPRRRCGGLARGRGVADRRVVVDLGPESIERVAVRVAELLERRRAQTQDDLICAGELARKLGVRRPWVYRHAIALGGARLGAGPKAEWRFELAEARARFGEMRDGGREQP